MSTPFASFLSTMAYPNRPLATDDGDPIDNSEVAGYKNANVTVDSANLVMTATHTSMTDYLGGNRTYTSGYVQTGGNIPTDIDIGFEFLYGHLEIDFTLLFLGGPTGIAGLHPGIRLTPRNGAQFPYPPEIDIVEMFGIDTFTSSVHFSDIVGDGLPAYENQYATPLDPTTGFHTVTMDWDSEHIEFALDGSVTGSYAGPAIPAIPLFLTLNLGIGGSLTTTPNASDFASGGAELRIARMLVQPLTGG